MWTHMYGSLLMTEEERVDKDRKTRVGLVEMVFAACW